MQIFRIEIPLKDRRSDFFIVPYGDEHSGKNNHASRYLTKLIEVIKGLKNVGTIATGDSTDCVSFSDKRFSANTIPDELLTGSPKDIKGKLANIYKWQTDQHCKSIAAIADKHLVSVPGNHEGKILQQHHFDVHDYKCEQLGILNGGNTCILNLVFYRDKDKRSSKIYRVLVTHKPPGGCGRLAGSKLNAMEKLAQMFDVDLVLAGHIHSPCYDVIQRVTSSIGKKPYVIYKDITIVNVGSATENYKQNTETYEEEAKYPAKPMFIYKIRIQPFKSDKAIFTDVEPIRVR